ncbi:MAG: glucosamine-6-phosphate deaminase [Luteolibacter sp.]
MEIIIQKESAQAAEIGARIIARQIKEKSDSVIGMATGSTPVSMYQKLIEMDLDWSQVTTFNLDEYIGLPKEHSQTYHSFMWENLFRHINIDASKVHIPDGNASDIPGHCAEYEAAIVAAGGIDIQVLGIGTDGHIGFNEPSSSLASRTRIKTLTERTVQDNARFFDSAEEVPRHVITMGIGTIMEARTNLLLAFGDNKSAAIAGAVEGPITANNPASILQMHPSVKVCLDDAAAEKLERAHYYRWVYDGKPEWQQF